MLLSGLLSLAGEDSQVLERENPALAGLLDQDSFLPSAFGNVIQKGALLLFPAAPSLTKCFYSNQSAGSLRKITWKKNAANYLAIFLA